MITRPFCHSSVPHPYGLAVLDEWLYWTDWTEKSLKRALKASGKMNTTIKRGLRSPMDVKTWPVNYLRK